MPPVWSTACPDWGERLAARQSLVPFDPLFPDEAEAALEIFRGLKLRDVAGSPTIAECSKEWVYDLPRALFGSYDAESGNRLIQNFFLLISKKNSKSSTEAAGIGITALLRNWRYSAEFLILAPTLEVAKNSFEPARDMILEDQRLRDILHVTNHNRTITHLVTNATLKVVAADSDTVGGKKATGVIVDELWSFGKRANAASMLREATGGLVARPEGFVIFLSTHSDEPPAGVFKQKLDYFRGVRDGRIRDNKSLALFYEWPDEMLKREAYLDRSLWHFTNPNLDASVSADWIADKLREAQEEGKDQLNVFLAKHLNVEIGQNLRTDRWAGADYWEEASDESIDIDALLSRCEVIVAGVDGGGLDDLLGLCLMGREVKSKRWLCWCFAWADREAIEQRRKAILAQLKDFEKAGEFKFVANLIYAHTECAQILERVDKAGLLGPIGFDPVGASGVLEALKELPRPIEGDERIKGVRQGYSLTGATKDVEVKLKSKDLLHAKQGLMAWCVGNAKIEARGNSVVVTKAASGSAKIDPFMALLDCADLMRDNPVALSSAYNDGHSIIVVGGASAPEPSKQPASVKDTRDPRGIMRSF